MRNGYGKTIKSNNLYGIDQTRIKQAEQSIASELQRLEAMESYTIFGTAKGDKAALAIELRIAKLNEQINRETKKAQASGRKNHGNG